MSYSKKQLHSVLKRFRQVVPEATSVRVDPVMKSKPNPLDDRARIYLEQDNRSLVEFTPPGADNKTRESTIHYIKSNLPCSREQAEAILEAGIRMAGTTKMGSWCLHPTLLQSQEVTLAHVDGKPHDPDSYLLRWIERMGQLMPHAETIEITYHQNASRSRIRSWLSVSGEQEETEIASIDSSAFALHIRSEMLRPPLDRLPMNLDRNQRWASSFGCQAKDIPELFTGFMFLTAALALTKVQLR